MRPIIILSMLMLVLALLFMPAVDSTAQPTTRHAVTGSGTSKKPPPSGSTARPTTARSSPRPSPTNPPRTTHKPTRKGETTTKSRSATGRKKRLSQWDWA